MCKYCNEIEFYNNDDLITDRNNITVFLYKDLKNELVIDVSDFCGNLVEVSIDINYCPICGRELN